MPEEVNGYELFQLPCSRESDETVGYAEYRNKMGEDGHYAQVLYGADTGLRRFSIPYDPLPGGTNDGTVTIAGVSMNKATYLRDLFRRTQVSGLPFVIQSGENSQYYLVNFAETEQTLKKKLAAMYSTQINLIQVRIPGVTVFDNSQISGILGWYKNAENVPGPFGLQWSDSGPLGNVFSGGNISTSGVLDVQNGLAAVSFDAGDEDWVGFGPTGTIYEAFFVLRINEPTFSNFSGILTGETSVAALVGNNGDIRFNNQSIGPTYSYRKNGIEYAEDNQLAPMETFGLVHLRWQAGITMTSMQIGKDRAATDRYATMDVGEVLLLSTLQPLSYSLEIAEHLQTRWAI